MSPQTEILINIIKFLIKYFKYIVGIIVVFYLVYDSRKTRKMEKLLNKLQDEKKINKTKEITLRTKNILNKMIIDDVNEKIHYIRIYRNSLKNYMAKEIDYKDILGIELVENRSYSTILVTEDIFTTRSTHETLHRVGFRINVNDFNSTQIEMIISNSKVTIPEYTVTQVHEWVAAIRLIMNRENKV